MTTPRVALACAALTGILLLASCAPPPVPGELGTFAARARSDLARRALRLEGAQAEMIVRLDGRATGRLPGFIVTASMATPERFRLRATWMLGTAFDMVIVGDSLRAWLPTEHALIETGGLSDSIGVTRPAELLRTLLAAAWDAPLAAWQCASSESGEVVVSWREGADSLTMRVDASGRPIGVRIERAGRTLVVRYSGWRKVRSLAWPTRVELLDGEGWFRVRTELQSLKAVNRVQPEWFELHIPSDAEHLDWQGVRERLAARGEDRP